METDLLMVDADGAAPFRSGTLGNQFAASMSAAWCAFGEVYLRVLVLPSKDTKGPYGWYVIGNDTSSSHYPLNNKKKKKKNKEGKLLKPVFEEEPRPPHFGPACVALGSFIYVLGGYVHNSGESNNDVFYIDTTRPSDGWKEGPSLLIPRSGASAAVMDDKIYVVDGLQGPWCFEEEFDAWSEVFDSDRFEWTICPKKMTLDTSTASLPHQQQLLLHAPLEALYTHNLQTKEWTLIDRRGFGNGNKGVYLDGILYCADGKLGVRAYDLIDRKWLPNSVRGLEKVWPPPDEDSMYPPIYLLHIGNKRLCMIWAETPPYPNNWQLDIHCAKFNIVRNRIFRNRGDKSGEQVLVAQNLTSSLYFIDAGVTLDNCLAVPLQEGMADKDVCCIKKENINPYVKKDKEGLKKAKPNDDTLPQVEQHMFQAVEQLKQLNIKSMEQQCISKKDT